MAETRTYNGYTYTRNAPGEPWQLVGPSQQQAQPVTIGTPDPYRAEDQAFQREQLRLAQEAARRAQEAQAAAEARASAKDAREAQALGARGGVETTEAERTAAFLATRVAGGLQDLKRIGNVGAPSLKDALAGGTLLGNYATEEGRQRTINAQRDILDAALTLGTGAAYTQEQIDTYRASYFPQPGDAPGTIADKGRRLQVLMNAAKIKAGAAAGQIDNALGELATDDAQRAIEGGANRQQIDAIAAMYGRQSFGEDLDKALAGRDTGAGVNVEMPKGGYSESALSQGLSGINEGIASTLGLPVDLANSALSLGAQGINALANTDLSVSQNPYLGSEWWRGLLGEAGAIGPETDATGMPFVRRVGQSVGANIIPGAVGARTGGQIAGLLASGLGGGIGAATAREVAPGNPWAEMGGEIAGSIAGGLPGIVRGQQVRQGQIEAAVPTVDQLKAQAGDLYRQAEANGITATPQQTSDLRDNIAAILAREGTISPTGRISEVHPKVREANQLIQDYAGQTMAPTQMQTVRSVIGDAASSAEPNERRIARLLMNEFDNFTTPLAPELADARAIASRYLQAQQLERARELAGARAGQFTGSGFENALRTEYRALDRDIIKNRENFAPAVEEQVRTVSRGTPASNIARGFGRMAPTGVVSAGLGTSVPFYIGNTVAGPVGGALAAGATLGSGIIGRQAATRMGIRNADIAELLARNGGDIQQADYITPDIERLIALGLLGQQSGSPQVEQEY